MDVKISEERKDSVVDYCNSKEYVFYAFENDNNIMRYNIRTGETMIIPTKLKGKMGLVYKEDSLFNMFEKVDYFEERKRKEEEYKKLHIIQDAVVLLIKLTLTEQMGRNQNLTEIFQIYNMREQCFVEKTA